MRLKTKGIEDEAKCRIQSGWMAFGRIKNIYKV